MRKRIVVAGVLIMIIVISVSILFRIMYVDQTEYSGAELGIQELQSPIDKDEDGIDDYTDILSGARAYIQTKPQYKSKYYDGGYPNDSYGVCTDVIWNAFSAAGYNLKALIDKDISENTSAYSNIETPDPNIDFRRVKNLNTFFKRYAVSLSLDFSSAEEWQAGDIVVFTKHIAICSDKRNKAGIPFIIHHDSKGAREKNDINSYKIIGHYRGSKLFY